MINMDEPKKRIASATIVAVMLVLSLGFLSYQFFPEANIPTSFAFVWLEGKQEPANNTITLLISTVSPTCTFQNETCWWTEEQCWRTSGIPQDLGRMILEGEHNATWLRSMSIQPYNIICTPVNLPFDGTYNITMVMNTTFYVSLEAVTNVDLGVYDCRNESYIVYQNETYSESSSIGKPTWNCSGYWEPDDTNWEIDVEKLSGMLQGSGTALITLRGALHANLNYEITINGVKKANEKNLSWEGNMGIIKVTYDQRRIIWIKYEIPAIGLTMLTMPT